MTFSFEFESRPSDSSYVDSFWRTESQESGSFTSVAQTHWGMVVTRYQEKMTLTMRGPETKSTPADYPAGVEFFGINFKPGTFMPHLPAKTIMDRQDLNLPEASNQSFWLNSSLWEMPTFENADTFIDRLVREAILAYEPIVDEVIQGQSPAWSVRSVQYRFLQTTGLTQKLFQQIERAKHAVHLLEEGTSILEAVHEAGYFDQAHLTRSLTRFMGQTPLQIAQSKLCVFIQYPDSSHDYNEFIESQNKGA